MKQGYYMVFLSSGEGVNRKIQMQIDEFNKYMDFTRIDIPEEKDSFAKKLQQIIPTKGVGYDFEYALRLLKNPLLLYIRKGNIDLDFVKFLKAVKGLYPECKIIIEFPVYPYYKELFSKGMCRNLKNIPIYIKDRLFRGQLKKYVDYISTFSEDEKIFNVPTLRIFNGIDVSSIVPIQNHELNETIDIFSVALLAPQHGYERIIKGMDIYYKNGGKRDIKFHIVGYGTETKYYESLVKKYHLEKQVILYGRRVGEELDKLYEIADLGVTHLAMYKVSRPLGSFIKTGEYLAKGLPLITGCRVDILDRDEFPYFIEFENNDSPIDMNKIISFYDDIYQNGDKEEVASVCRKLAFQKADMPVALRSITDYMRTLL